MDRTLNDTKRAFYKRVRQRRLEERAAVRLKAVEDGNNASVLAESVARIPLSLDDAEHLAATLGDQLYKLKMEAKKGCGLVGARSLYLLDDRVSEALGLAELNHGLTALSFMQSYGAPAAMVSEQRKEVGRLEAAHTSLVLRTDEICHASLRLERLALAELDAAIRLREVELGALGR